jgi:propionyl-CoA synthetase
MEEVMAVTPYVAEFAVLGVDVTLLKGQGPIGFIVLKAGITSDNEEIIKEVIHMVRDLIGPGASFKTATVINLFLKTRSGKKLRGSI